MNCPSCGSSSLEFYADKFTCTSCGKSFPSSKLLDFLEPIGDWLNGGKLDDPRTTTRDTHDDGFTDSLSDLTVATWRIVGESMAPSIRRVRRYGDRYDKLDAARDGRMREYLGRSIREQFDLDLETIVSRLAISDGKVEPVELALINSAFGSDFTEADLRKRAKNAEDEEGDFFSKTPQSLVAAVVYDNHLYAETGNPDDSCAELLLRTIKTLCEELLICDGIWETKRPSTSRPLSRLCRTCSWKSSTRGRASRASRCWRFPR